MKYNKEKQNIQTHTSLQKILNFDSIFIMETRLFVLSTQHLIIHSKTPFLIIGSPLDLWESVSTPTHVSRKHFLKIIKIFLKIS